MIDTRELAAEVTSSLLQEIKSMRNALEQQFSSLNWNGHERRGAVREHLLRNLLAAGFSIPLANGLMAQLPEHRDDGNGEEDAMNHIKTTLTRNLKTISSEDEILEKGGIYALVGPTGVGKTTTTAKLAARCVVRHGADKLALLTTDGYRIGGHEQLRIYGKILGVTVYAVKDAQDLALALGELRGKHMVLIDTVGVGQRDQMVAEQIAMFAGCGTEVKRLLLLNASSNLHTLNEVAEAYGGHGLAGAIITKLDEAVIMGCALDTAIRHHLPLYYVAQGQRVPEDLSWPTPGAWWTWHWKIHLPLLISDWRTHFRWSRRTAKLPICSGNWMELVLTEPIHDQAEGLRRLLVQDFVRIVTVASGKAGAGKTTTVINLAAYLARAGKKVLIIDENAGANNLSTTLGLNAHRDLLDVIRRDKSLDQVIVGHSEGQYILPAGRGMRVLDKLSAGDQAHLIGCFAHLAQPMDVVLIDTAPGGPAGYSRSISAGMKLLVVVSPEPPRLPRPTH